MAKDATTTDAATNDVNMEEFEAMLREDATDAEAVRQNNGSNRRTFMMVLLFMILVGLIFWFTLG